MRGCSHRRSYVFRFIVTLVIYPFTLIVGAYTPSVAVADAPPACPATDLRATTSVQGAAQAVTGPILFTNTSTAACMLKGTPSVQILDRSASDLTVTEIKKRSPSGATAQAVLLQPGQQAKVIIFWRNFCQKTTHPGPYSVQVALPGGGALIAPLVKSPGVPFPAPPCGSSSAPSTISVQPFAPVATTVPHDNRFFPQTGFRIDNDTIWDYFNRRGGVNTFGYPVSRTFTFQGFTVQFFQRRIVQLDHNGHARLLNVLDSGLMPYTSFNGATVPSIDSGLVASAPPATDSGATLAFVKNHAPNSVNGRPVNFDQTFANTVSASVAFPNGGNASLLPGFDLEMWGIPTSAVLVDPNNHNFIYLRFQRGIMMYDGSCNCTQGALLADYLKDILTGQNLPPDLNQEAQNSPFYKQYDPSKPNWVHNPSLLPNTDLTNAFTPE